ncbi:hypothetical protein KFS98_003632 [Salmonella enterica]|nr:hypothetical protein [Salmonella enterica]
MSILFVLCPRGVESKNDGQIHHISAVKLIELYGLKKQDKTMLMDSVWSNYRSREEFERIHKERGIKIVYLGPRYHGNYDLEKEIANAE